MVVIVLLLFLLK